MHLANMSADIKGLQRRNRYLSGIATALAAAQVLAAVTILQLLGSVRTVVVPPSIEKPFWVSQGAASSSYLDQMGAFVAWLVLDVTPASVDWKKDVLLSYVDPALYGVLQSRQDVEAQRLKRINASTTFAPQQLVANEGEQSVIVRGRLRTLVNGLETGNEVKAYRIEFSHSSARVQLKAFKEVTDAAR
jgi:conjugal transfer pilus assembly protein TraE